MLCAIGGGASRADVLSLLYLRPAAIVALLVFLLTPGRWDFGRIKTPLILLGVFAATMAMQLIPLPPALWLSLPGHGGFAEGFAAAELEAAWRPISLTPDMTLNSLLALLPALVVLIGFAGIREDQRRLLLPILIGLVCIDAVWSIFQFTGGSDSPAYLYAVTNQESTVGLFANRNHHAALLALGFPLIGVWMSMPSRSRDHFRNRIWAGLAIALFLVPAILATGSRAGLILGALGLLALAFLAPRLRFDKRNRWRRPLQVALWLLPIALVAVTIFANRAVSIERFSSTDGNVDEIRSTALPTLFDMIKDFIPQGAGYGAFDPAFRIYESDALLRPSYFNHAHNDLIELAIVGGLPALVVLGLFLVWWLRGSWGWFLGYRGKASEAKFARLGSIIIALLLAGSLVDYPLRTPLLSVVFAIACAWLAARRSVQQDEASDEAPSEEARDMVRWSAATWGVRGAIGIVAAVGLGWVTMGVTAARTIGRVAPESVLAWWPVDADLKVRTATAALQEGGGRRRPSPRALAYIAGLSRSALEREPANVAAVRTLGIVLSLQADEPRAKRLMEFAETLSRRDVPTQLWLIENSVQQNDIPAALHHYDRALRTSPAAGDLLFPVLIEASASPDVRRPLARMIASRPTWWIDFARRFVVSSRSAPAIMAIMGGLRLNPEDVSEKDLLVAAFARLLELRAYAEAAELHRRTVGGQADTLVRNGSFQSENPLPPFDWLLTEQMSLYGRIEARTAEQGGRALIITAGNGSSGEVARQLLTLRPGNYRLSAETGNIISTPAERPQILILCLYGDAVLQYRMPQSPASGATIVQGFSIPASGCRAQWLMIRATSPLNGSAPDFWMDNIAIRRRG